jgi:predicted flap endonuclease-1-like 5' DNA nuclease
LLVLLGFAAGCAFGLFFGWLLHRERVERALYEDVVRTRDRATSTLAETSARLELANKDMVRLRGQLTNAQHLLAERDATIGELEDELVELEDGDVQLRTPPADEPIDVAADAATTPDGVHLFDDDLDETDITEEVPLPPEDEVTDEPVEAEEEPDRVSEPEQLVVDEPPEQQEEPEEEADAPLEVGEPPEQQEEPDRVSEPGLLDLDEPPELHEPPETDEGGEPGDEAHDAPEPAEPAPIGDVVVGDAPATDMPLDVTAAEDAARGVDSGRPAAQVASEASEQPPDDAEIGTPLVLETDAPQQQREIDDLQRISGVGPALERQLHAEGITTYRQLAVLDETAIGALDSRRPRLVTRMRRGGWVAQARRLHVETHGTQP